uniref:Testin n=1 Tax=Angiostrongylus cantonensis TaxID=6313 RepID=A0A158P9V9_ANGCA
LHTTFFHFSEVGAVSLNAIVIKDFESCISKRPKFNHVLAHEVGQGSLCRKCDCSGLDLHFWRKLCKNCGCRMDEHDVQLPNHSDYGQIIIAAYNFKVENDKGTRKTVTEYSWVPVPDKSLVERYMLALPEQERPIVGSVGEQNRKFRLQYQLPLYDCNVEDARFADEKGKEMLRRFVENVRKHFLEICAFFIVMKSYQMSLIKCKSCAATIPVGDVGIKTDHGSKGEMWHPNCFRCAECNQLLVDMLYFHFQGKYYCGRHFADQQYPRCAGCDELIFAREYTFAEEKSWHFDHFACFKCDFRLGGHRYMTKNEQPHCIDCYMKYFARSCDTCGEKIGADEKRLNYQDYHWHAKMECFHCRQCDMDLIGKKFLFKDRNLFCSSQCKVAYRNKSL